jgi:predicted GNAT superfamily acetyltransferase
VIKHGGLALGAFDNDELIGFVFGFLGKVEDERAAWMGMPYVHCSEMMGILPDYQSQSVGYQLKLLQREYALKQGHHLMIWTFDPLLSRNAWLNVGKLGCVVRHYIRDAYGDMGGIYAGLSTDRFEAEWWLQSKHALNHITETPPRISLDALRDSGAEIINSGILGENSVLYPSQVVHAGDEPVLLVEIPGDFQSLKQKDLGAAKAWRQHTRALFEALFEAGYLITNFVHAPDQQIERSYYVLSKNIQVPDMAESKR